MNISFDIAGILISSFICFALAALWFSSALFGNLWLKQLSKNGLVAHELNKLRIFVYVFLFLILFATVENIIVDGFKVNGMKEGIGIGIIVWFLITSAHGAIHFAFERRTIILFGIYSSYYLAASVIIATLLSMRR
ncbi:MAG: DUF1761 domain-containing protein [Bacteroidota bacterium]|nr:DUF1761 domain-containing protein [Bacteroidota bacterium]